MNEIDNPQKPELELQINSNNGEVESEKFEETPEQAGKSANPLFGIAGQVLKTVGEAGSTVGSFATSSLGNLAGGAERAAKLTFAPTGDRKSESVVFSPEEAAHTFANWLRQKRKDAKIEIERSDLENATDGEFYTLILEESGLLASRYLFAFASRASEVITGYLTSGERKKTKYAGVALVSGKWPPRRFSLAEENMISVFIWSDRVRLGKGSGAADYISEWLLEEVTGFKFEEKPLIEKPAEIEVGEKAELFTGSSHAQALSSLEGAILAPPNQAKKQAWLFTINAQGGAGKSYLLTRLQQLYNPRMVYVKIDHQRPEEDQERSLANLMDELATRLRESGCSTKKFDEAYRQLISFQATKTAPDLGDDFKSMGKDSAGIAQNLSKVFKAKSHSGRVAGVLQMAGMSASIAGDLYNIFNYYSQKAGVVLENRAIQELTKALVQDLIEFSSGQRKYFLLRRPVLVFDSYEQLSTLCDQWLRTLLLPALSKSEVDPVILLVGRYDPVRRDTRWAEYQGHMQTITLQSFSEAETFEYLEKLGVEPAKWAEIYALTQGWPLLTALAARLGTHEEAVQAMTDRILEEIDPRWQQIFLDLAVPEGFNLDVVQKVLAVDKSISQSRNAEEAFNYLRQASFIEGREGLWHYLPPIRQVLLRFGELKSPAKVSAIRNKLSS